MTRRLRHELRRRDLSPGTAVATIHEIINKGRIPWVATLFRPVAQVEVPREGILHLTGRLEAASGPDPENDFLIRQMVEEFRKLPAVWEEEAIEQPALSARPANRIIGEDDERERQPADDCVAEQASA